MAEKKKKVGKARKVVKMHEKEMQKIIEIIVREKEKFFKCGKYSRDVYTKAENCRFMKDLHYLAKSYLTLSTLGIFSNISRTCLNSLFLSEDLVTRTIRGPTTN